MISKNADEVCRAGNEFGVFGFLVNVSEDVSLG
jgi:hypothetical protein